MSLKRKVEYKEIKIYNNKIRACLKIKKRTWMLKIRKMVRSGEDANWERKDK